MPASPSENLFTGVFSYLNKHAEYAVLRNYEELPGKNSSRDIDLILSRSCWRNNRRALLRIMTERGWKLLTLLRSDRLVTWVVARMTPGGLELVQWDFFFETSVFGIRLMEAQELLKDRVFNGFLYHVSPANEFLDKYLYDRAVGASYPARYARAREMAEQDPAVLRKLERIFGMESVEACDRAGKSRLLKHALLHHLRRRPFRQAKASLTFLYTFWRNYLTSRTGFSVGFTGPDGSGKTTVINLVIDQLGDVFRKAHVLHHFRPTLFGNLGEMAHASGLKKEVDRNYEQPHRGGKTGKLSSGARLLYYSLDYILGYWTRVKTHTRITSLVIFDRYYTDIIADSRRSRIYLNHRFLYWFGRVFIPSLDYNILLTAGENCILARKRELDAEGIRSINEKLRYLAGKKGYRLVLNEKLPEDAAREILSLIMEEQHRKNLKRLGTSIN